jgi:hypothetical protein
LIFLAGIMARPGEGRAFTAQGLPQAAQPGWRKLAGRTSGRNPWGKLLPSRAGDTFGRKANSLALPFRSAGAVRARRAPYRIFNFKQGGRAVRRIIFNCKTQIIAAPGLAQPAQPAEEPSAGAVEKERPGRSKTGQLVDFRLPGVAPQSYLMVVIMILIETMKYNPDFLFHCVPSPDHPHCGLDLSQCQSFILVDAAQTPHCMRIQQPRLSYGRPIEPFPCPAAHCAAPARLAHRRIALDTWVKAGSTLEYLY